MYPWWQTLNSKAFYFQITSLFCWFCAVPVRGFRRWFRFRGTVCCLWVSSVTIWFSDLHSLHFHWEDKPGWVCCRELSLLLGVDRGVCNFSAGPINGNFARFASLEFHLVRDETWLTGPQREFECNRCQCNMQLFSFFLCLNKSLKNFARKSHEVCKNIMGRGSFSRWALVLVSVRWYWQMSSERYFWHL